MEKQKTNLIVKIEKLAWMEMRLIAESKGIKKDEAFQEAIVDYNKKHRKMDTDKLMEGT